MTTTPDLDLLAELIAKARAGGADAADAVLLRSASLSVERRLGNPEGIERAESGDLGLRVFLGRRQAVASSTDLSADALDGVVEMALAMARAAPEDPWCGLAEPGELANSFPDLDIADPAEPDGETLDSRAAAAEDAARAVGGVTNSEGAQAGWSRTEVTHAASNGFAGNYVSTRSSVGVSVLAGEGTGMERDYEFDSKTHGADLRDGAEVGAEAGNRAVRRLHPRKSETGEVPVIFENRVAGGLLRSFAGAISGPAIARGTSFLKDSMNQAVFPANITIVDDPHRQRGLRSKPFDAEGVANTRRALVADGVLQSWILDCASARQLSLATTGNAARGVSGPPSPSPTNLYLEPGEGTLDDLIKAVDRGFLVTELMGMGVSMVTGDYSRGAAGLWIENGEIAYPVSEVTVAGNLKDMYLALTAAGDLQFRGGTDAPSLRVDGMTVAGK